LSIDDAKSNTEAWRQYYNVLLPHSSLGLKPWFYQPKPGTKFGAGQQLNFMKRFAIIRPYANLPSDGASNDRYVNLCRELQTRKVDVHLVCSTYVHNRKARRSKEESENNRKLLPFVREIDSTAYRDNISIRRIIHEGWFGIKALFFVSRKRPTDLLIGEPVFFVGWIFLAYAYLFRIRIKADIIDLWPEADIRDQKNVVRASLYALLQLSRRLRLSLYGDVSFVSRSHARILKADQAVSNVFYWGSDLMPDLTVKPKSQPLAIIYAGSFGEGYDLATVLEAAKMIAETPTVSVRIRFAGQGAYSEIIKRAADAGLIEYLGNVNRETLAQIYSESDIGLLPYMAGSMVAMPIKFFDYLNFGLFCLSSLKMEAKEILDREGVGQTYEAGDSRDLYEKIVNLAMHPEKLINAVRPCRAVASQFSIPVQYNAFANWLEE
jgi:hypothetical protein